jgi:acetyl-CoA C-acetyltransferase
VTIDPRTPVIIGAAQVAQKPPVDDVLVDAPDALGLITDAVRGAAEDTGGSGVLEAIDLIAVVGGLWRYKNPGAMVADELGIDANGMLTTFGGNLPIHATHMLADRIAAGEIEMAVLAGGECNLTRRNLAKAGAEPPRREESRADDVEHWGPPLNMGDRVAIDRGGELPRNTYAILDSAIRATRDESLDDARDRAAALWAGYAAVAAGNAHAADRQGLTADAIREPSPTNRMVSWPYTKAMCANNNVDQAAALIICSTAVADRLDAPVESRVYPHLCVVSYDSPTLVDRDALSQAPGLSAAGAALREQVGDLDEVDHVDLYSCFPAIVSLTCEALGLSPDRQLTVAGGLAFAGAPLNFAAGQALVAMIHALRADPGARGLVQGNGGHATKHALGLYSTTPPEVPAHIDDLGLFGSPPPIAASDHEGAATILGATVEFGRAGAERAVAVVEFEDGSRSWANSDDVALMDAITTHEMCGQTVSVVAGEMRLS